MCCLYIYQIQIYFSLGVPCYFVLSTIFGGIALFFACICYFIVSDNTNTNIQSFQ